MVREKIKKVARPNLSLGFSFKKNIKLPNSWFRRAKLFVRRAVGWQTKDRVVINVAIVSSRVIKDLNKRYRRINKVTNVLSFTYLNQGKKLEGDIIICLAKARQQARALKHSLRDELDALLVHGLLHLMGFDHQAVKDKKKMIRAEILLLGHKRRLVSETG